ncbi:MAG: ECF transporter S component [Oscillospiraceae bacterium]
MEKKKFDARMICMIGIMAALVFVGTNLRVKIPAGADGVMLHFGNVFCILSGLLFGGVPGGLAAGIGSGLFDLTSEYASEAWITFITKFAMGFVAGLLANGFFVKAKRQDATTADMQKKDKGMLRTAFAAICGSLTYVVLYVIKSIIMQRFVYGLPWEGVWPIVLVKGSVSLTNGIIAVIASLILAAALRPALKRARILP